MHGRYVVQGGDVVGRNLEDVAHAPPQGEAVQDQRQPLRVGQHERYVGGVAAVEFEVLVRRHHATCVMSEPPFSTAGARRVPVSATTSLLAPASTGGVGTAPSSRWRSPI